jgi:hypothetical protein
MLITPKPADPRVEEELRRVQCTPEERHRRFPPKPAFSYRAWQEEAPPATSEELDEWEQFLRERDVDREASLAQEAGFGA